MEKPQVGFVKNMLNNMLERSVEYPEEQQMTSQRPNISALLQQTRNGLRQLNTSTGFAQIPLAK